MSSKKLNMTQAIVNIFNFCIGVGLLVKPYAFVLCGIYAYPAMLLAAMICIYTGSVLGKVANKYANDIIADQQQQQPLNNKRITPSNSSDTLSMKYTNDIICNINNEDTSSSYDFNRERKHSTDSAISAISSKHEQTIQSKSVYPTLTKLSLYIPKYPKLAVYGTNYVKFSVLACQITIIINFIIMNWTLLYDILYHFISNDYMDGISSIALGETALFIYTSIIMLSTFLFLSWDGITWLSWISALSVLVLSSSMIVFALVSYLRYDGPVNINMLDKNSNIQLDTNTAGIAAESMSVLEAISVTFSLFVMGITAHAVLPLIYIDLREDLKTNKQWNRILFLSFGGAAIFYTIIGSVGGWLYGYYTNIVILHNIFEWPGGLLSPFISLVVFINIFSSFGICGTVLFEVVEKSTFVTNGYSDNTRRIFRICCGILLCGFTYVMRRHLAFFAVANCFLNVMGVALTMPLVMYLVAFYKTLSVINRIIHVILIILSMFIGILTVYTDIVSLY